MAAAKNEQVIEIRPIELETVSLKIVGDTPLPYFPVKTKKETPAEAEPEFTVKCGESEVAAKPGVMVLKSDTIHLTGEQPSSSFGHSLAPHEG